MWNVISQNYTDRWLIQYRKSGDSAWINSGTANTQMYRVNGLTASTDYEVRVFGEAGDVAWEGVRSEASDVVSFTTRPAKPTNVTVSSYTDTRVNLVWETASPHGADRWVTQCSENGGEWYDRSTTTYKGYSASELDPSSTYQFRVYGERGSTAWSGVRSPVSSTVTVTTREIAADSLSAEALQSAFYNAPNGGDWDGYAGLQCVDLYRWFIDTYTTLESTSGNGKDCAANLASKYGLSLKTVPTNYSVFSVSAGYTYFGCDGSEYGHTGIVVSVDAEAKTCKVLHTGNQLEGQYPNSWIDTYSYANTSNAVKFVDVSGYLK